MIDHVEESCSQEGSPSLSHTRYSPISNLRPAPDSALRCLQFHFENMKLKAQQRIREGRQQPVDPLAVNLFLMPEFDASVSAPHAIFIGLTLSEVEDVRDEIMTWQVGRQAVEPLLHLTPRVATMPLLACSQMPGSAGSPLQAEMVMKAFLYEQSATLCSVTALLASKLLLEVSACWLLAPGLPGSLSAAPAFWSPA